MTPSQKSWGRNPQPPGLTPMRKPQVSGHNWDDASDVLTEKERQER